MNYPETLEYLYHALPMFSRVGSAAYKKDITNTRLLCAHLGDPQNKFKSIHIAGTNGKGSVSHMLAAIFQSAGYKTGLYTSPHLYDFRERIRIDGEMIDEDFVVGFVENIRPLIDKIGPSFFEITVAMAFDYFAKQEVDIGIIEVGLGGRLDSTNIIEPELSVITNIGWDHMNLLGNTLTEIASEKAGIIKPGIPVVIGEKKETATTFIEAAKEKQSPIYFAEDRFAVEDYELKDGAIMIAVHDRQIDTVTKYNLDLGGLYQAKNILTLLQALALLPPWKIPADTVQQALTQVKKLTGLHGRWEVIHQHPRVVLEVAHNVDGIAQMLSHLEKISYDTLHLVIGVVRDKDVDKVLELLPANARYYFTSAHIPRALEANELQATASTYSLEGNIFDDVNHALQSALDHAAGNDLIIVCGSIFLVAEVDRKSIGQLS